VRASGRDAGTYTIDGGRPRRFARIRSLTIRGHGGHDVCRIVHPPHGLFAPPGGIRCIGGNAPGQPRRGVLQVRGGRATSYAYRPSATPGSGEQVSRRGAVRQVIRFSGLAPVMITVSSPSLTVTDPITDDTIGLVSTDVANGTWMAESLAHPGAWETEQFTNQGAVTIDATKSADDAVLEPVCPENGLTNLTVDADGSIALLGVDVGPAPVALQAGMTITGAGAGPQLTAGGLAAVAPGGIGPLTTDVSGFAGTASTGPIALTNAGPLVLGPVLGQTGVSGTGGVQLTSRSGALTNDATIRGPEVDLSADAMSLAGGAVVGGDVALAPVTAGAGIQLGGSGSGAGDTLGLPQVALKTIKAGTQLTLGGPSTGAITVAGPVSSTTPLLELAGTGGFGATGNGSIAGGSLTLHDDGHAGRPWTIGPGSIADGLQSPIPYKTSGLDVDGGSGSDTFHVTPSSTPVRVDGGAGAGHALTYEAGGKVVTGAAVAPRGDLSVPGSGDLLYTGMETVKVADPGQPPAASVPPAACSITPKSTQVKIGTHSKPKPAPFTVLVACDQAVSASVRATLTVTRGASHSRGGHKHGDRTGARAGVTKRRQLSLKMVRRRLKAGRIAAVTRGSRL
jgi:hypothetical protein